MITPATKAAVKPSTSASGAAEPDAIASAVREVAIVESAAMPSAPPICCDVLIRPDASPASAACTPASAAIEIGTNEKPMPIADQQEARAAGRRGTSRRPRPA